MCQCEPSRRRIGATASIISGIEFASDRNLREYWTRGEGAAKIAWGTEGDLTRCHGFLTKYVGSDDAWGLCNNYHKSIFGRPNDPDD